MGEEKVKSIKDDLEKQYDLLEKSMETEDSKTDNDKHYEELEMMQDEIDELIDLTNDILDAYDDEDTEEIGDLEKVLQEKIGSVM